jgi:hypothetical protein
VTYQYNYENKNELKKPKIVKKGVKVEEPIKPPQDEEEEEEEEGGEEDNEENGEFGDADDDEENDMIDDEGDETETKSDLSKSKAAAAAAVPELPLSEEQISYDNMSTTMKNNRLHAQKQKIAILCEAILGDPEEGLKSNMSLIGELEQSNHMKFSLKYGNKYNSSMNSLFGILFDYMKNDPDVRLRELSMLSIMAVLRDVIPAYRIRLPTAAEKAMKVSKEIKKLRDYEFSLITFYQGYLKYLETCAHAGNVRWCSQQERDYAVVGKCCW